MTRTVLLNRLHELNAKLDNALQFARTDDEPTLGNAIGKVAKTGLMVAGGLSLAGGLAGGVLGARKAWKQTAGLTGKARGSAIGAMLAKRRTVINQGIAAKYGMQ